jgi:hypothetical protein
MTAAEWDACADPTPMLELLRGGAGDRKLRLFVAACCRRAGSRLDGDAMRLCVGAAERLADGAADDRFAEEVRRAVDAVVMERMGVGAPHMLLSSRLLATSRRPTVAAHCARHAAWCAGEVADFVSQGGAQALQTPPRPQSAGRRPTPFGTSSATPSGPRQRSIRLGSHGRAARFQSWRRPSTTAAASVTCPSSPTPWKRPGVPTPPSWRTAGAAASMYAAVGQWTC